MSATVGQAPAHVRADLLEEGRVLRLSIDRPKGNILTMAVMAELSAALQGHRDDPRLRLVFLRGAGGHFSFGASVEEHRPDEAPRMLEAFHGLVRELAAYPVPVAALVEGRCLGGAFEVVLCCHLVFAQASAVFACPEIKLGVFPPVLAAVGHLRLGGPLAERLIITGGDLPAEVGERVGFVTSLFPREASAEDGLLGWYREHLASLSAYAIREATAAARAGSGILEALGAGLDALERRYVERIIPSHDGREGIDAFLARRPPRWEDR